MLSDLTGVSVFVCVGGVGRGTEGGGGQDARD